MKRTLFALAAGVASVLAVAPSAEAKPPVRGDQAFVLNLDSNGDELQCAGHDINWWGTIDIVGDDHGPYGMALYDIGIPPRFPGSTFHWQEGFRIWTGLFDPNGDGIIESGDCRPGEMILYGTDKGVTSFARVRNPGFHSTGTVLDASGPFDGWQGRFVFQEGSGTFTTIVGTLRIN
jgi:hypothetical protein